LFELAQDFAKNGGKLLMVDEIHKYPDWSRELKMIYDLRPALQVVFTGSSILDIDRGEQTDLSRRAIMYEMQGLSFREYLGMFRNLQLPVIPLEDVINGKFDSMIQLDHPLVHFRSYLQNGYYPFSNDADFRIRLQQVVERVILYDIPYYANLNVSTAQKLKHLINIISRSVPFKPNYQSLSQMLEITRSQVKDYIYYMEKAGLIGQLRDTTGGIRALGKVEKIYIDNPSLAFHLADGRPDMGNIRETFFYNQMRQNHPICTSVVSDFEIGELTFEVGGKNKSKKQIASVKNGYVVRDDTEFACGNIIPLYQFGFGY
jgi:predicted AAA+ superfamily ATPase